MLAQIGSKHHFSTIPLPPDGLYAITGQAGSLTIYESCRFSLVAERLTLLHFLRRKLRKLGETLFCRQPFALD
jgi:hypothetical protein